MEQIEGWIHPTGSAKRVPAHVRASGIRVEIHLLAGADSSYFDLRSVDVSARVGDIPRRITLPDGSVFVTEDNDGIDRLLVAAGRDRGRGLLHRLERLHPRLLVLALLVLIVLSAGLRWGLPAIADVSARFTPHEVLGAMGQGTLSVLDATLLGPSDLEVARRNEISAAFENLVAVAGIEGQARLYFRGGGHIGANAFALPGAHVVITDELVRVAETTDMAAAVLAHEIAHAELRHPSRMVYRAGGIALVLLLVAGDAGSLVEEALGLGALVLQAGYSRNFERQADDRAAQLLTTTGRDPENLAAMLTRLLEDCGPACEGGGWLSTHPALAERISGRSAP